MDNKATRTILVENEAYVRGYKDGYLKAYEMFYDLLQTTSQPRPIIIDNAKLLQPEK